MLFFPDSLTWDLNVFFLFLLFKEVKVLSFPGLSNRNSHSAVTKSSDVGYSADENKSFIHCVRCESIVALHCLSDAWAPFNSSLLHVSPVLLSLSLLESESWLETLYISSVQYSLLSSWPLSASEALLVLVWSCSLRGLWAQFSFLWCKHRLSSSAQSCRSRQTSALIGSLSLLHWWYVTILLFVC